MTKSFYPTYLYIKTHNITGLKYFGKTTGNPYKYHGSGKFWKNHLKKHGYDISTEIVGFYTNREECVSTALKFSFENNIVGSTDVTGRKIWANEIVENGIDGGNTGRSNYKPHTDETKQKIANANKGRDAWNKGTKGLVPGNTTPRSDITKQKLSEANTGKKQSAETIEKRRSKMLGHKVSVETREKIRQGHLGKKVSEETKQKLRNRVVSEETKNKIKAKRKNQIITEETKKKLVGKVLIIDKEGKMYKISKDQYYSQTGPKEDWEWVFHKSTAGKLRR